MVDGNNDAPSELEEAELDQAVGGMAALPTRAAVKGPKLTKGGDPEDGGD